MFLELEEHFVNIAIQLRINQGMKSNFNMVEFFGGNIYKCNQIQDSADSFS